MKQLIDNLNNLQKVFFVIILLLSLSFCEGHVILSANLNQEMDVDMYLSNGSIWDDTYETLEIIGKTDLTSNLKIGWYNYGDGGKRNRIDYYFEYVSKFKDENNLLGLEFSTIDYGIAWRPFPVNKEIDFYINFGPSYVLDFEVAGMEPDYDSESVFSGYVHYGFGLLFNKKLKFSFETLDMSFASKVPMFTDGYFRFDYNVSRINIGYLFKI